MKKYFENLKKNENKGFSLVELIIVMAIMAILVGIVASQVIPYMEKSRQSKDQQVLSSVLTDIESAVAQSGEACKASPAAGTELDNLAAVTNDKTVDEFLQLRSASSIGDLYTKIQGQFGSKLYTDSTSGNKKIWVTVHTDTGKISVTCGSAEGSKGNKNYVETE